jgi:hypothetical protein
MYGKLVNIAESHYETSENDSCTRKGKQMARAAMMKESAASRTLTRQKTENERVSDHFQPSWTLTVDLSPTKS